MEQNVAVVVSLASALEENRTLSAGFSASQVAGKRKVKDPQPCSPPTKKKLYGQVQVLSSFDVDATACKHICDSCNKRACAKTYKEQFPRHIPSKADKAVSDVILSEVQNRLPYPWFAVKEEDGINVLLLSRTHHRTVQRRAFFSFHGAEEVIVHYKQISGDLLKCILQCNGDASVNTRYAFAERVLSVVDRFRSYEVCVGVDDSINKPLWDLETSGEIDRNPYNELRYQETFRPSDCLLLVNTDKVIRRRCPHCIRTKIRFRYRMETHASINTNPSTPNVHMDRSQLLKKLYSQQERLKYSRSRIARLKAELQNATAFKGVQSDDDLSDELVRICMAFVKCDSS